MYACMHACMYVDIQIYIYSDYIILYYIYIFIHIYKPTNKTEATNIPDSQTFWCPVSAKIRFEVCKSRL